MIPVVVRRLAEADIEQARAWYVGEDERLGVRFTEEVSRTIERIGALPDQFPEVGRGVRRALLHRFPYAAYFIRRDALAIVIAVLHQHRRPGTWRRRAKPDPAV
jgi:plasmid stabilization system protein ParE